MMSEPAAACTPGAHVLKVPFHKAAASQGMNSCVEAAECECGNVHMRDSKDQDGPALTFAGAAWAAFLSGIRAGEFDPEETQ